MGLRVLDDQAKIKNEITVPVSNKYYFELWGASPVLIDFNNDGYLDIILQSDHYYPMDVSDPEIYKTKIYVLTFNKKINSNRLDWPTFLHDNRNTSIFIKDNPSR